MASQSAVSRFTLTLGDQTPCIATPVASQQLLAFEVETPVEIVGVMTAPEAVRSQAGARSRALPRRSAATATPTRRYQDLVLAAAREHDIDPDLLHAIMAVESAANPRAVSSAGAIGLMQVMPATARRFGVREPTTELYDPRANIAASAAYLKTLQGLFGNDLSLVLAAYNAGEGAVRKYGRTIPPYRETQAYVRNVLARYDQFLQAAAAPPSAVITHH